MEGGEEMMPIGYPVRARFIFAALVICVGIGSSLAGAPAGQRTATREDHVVWVAEALKRMETIKPGMTRKELLEVFTTEGRAVHSVAPDVRQQGLSVFQGGR
jgi:hypothetical protein